MGRPAAKARGLTEKELQANIIELALYTGWLAYHPWISVNSAAGFPDLTLVRAPELIFVEVKGPRGKVSAAQHQWIDALSRCPGVEAYIWRPSDWDAIEARLTTKQAPAPKLWPFCGAGVHQRCSALKGLCTCQCHHERDEVVKKGARRKKVP